MKSMMQRGKTIVGRAILILVTLVMLVLWSQLMGSSLFGTDGPASPPEPTLDVSSIF